MITPAYVRTMALYNSEMNRRVYDGAARLTDEQRRADRGLFFKSLHGTLNHLMWADRQWMSRLDGWQPNTVPNTESPTLIHDFDELDAERVKADARIEEFARRIDQPWLDADLVWWSGGAKAEMRRVKRDVMVHFFNHQTHHRGQVHAALTQCGVDPGATDVLFLIGPQPVSQGVGTPPAL